MLEIVFRSSLHVTKPPQVFRTLLSILAYHNHVTYFMVLILPLISIFYRLLTKNFETVASTSLTSGITVIFLFLSYLFFYFLFFGMIQIFVCFRFLLFPRLIDKFRRRQISFFLFFMNTSSIFLNFFFREKVICLYLKIPVISFVLYSRTDSGFCRYNLLKL